MVSIGTSHSDTGGSFNDSSGSINYSSGIISDSSGIISDSGGSINDTGIFKFNGMDSNITSKSDNTALSGERSGSSSHQHSSRNYFTGPRYFDDSYGKQFKSWHPASRHGCTHDHSYGRSSFFVETDNDYKIQAYEASGSIAFRSYDGDTGQA